MNFFLGFVKGDAYVPTLPTAPEDLKTQIVEFCARTYHDVLQTVSEELEYGFSIVWATLAAHSDCTQIFIFEKLSILLFRVFIFLNCSHDALV